MTAMSKSTFLILLITLFFIGSESFSQTQEVKFTEVTGVSGLTLGKINAFAQDKYGFLWLSDQDNRSIIRYDGTNMQKYAYNPEDPDDPKALGGYYPECFYIEESGIIWIGFYGQGLDRFDPHSNTFTHYRHDRDDPESLSNDIVTSILSDHQGNLWIGTYSGLDLFDRTTGKFTNKSYDAADAHSLSCDTIRSLYEDHQGTLWVGTGLAWASDKRGGLNRYNRDTGNFTRYMHDPKNPKSLINNKVRAIFEDSKGNFWIGTGGDGLHTMNRESGEFTRHTYDPANPNKLSRPPVNEDADRITFINEDSEGHIWIGTDQNGINRYNPRTQTMTHFGEIVDNSVWSMYKSKDDQIWISTNRGKLLKINLYHTTVPLVEERLNTIIKESPAITWLGTNDGLIKQNLENGTHKRFKHDPKDPNSLSSDFIGRMIMNNSGILWVGTPDTGINRLDPDTEIITRYKHDPDDSSSLGNNDMRPIFEDSNSNLWIGLLGGGLDKMDRQSGKFTHHKSDPFNNRSINGEVILDIVEGDENTLWVALLNNGGLNKFDLETGYFSLYLHGSNVLDLCKDSRGILWAATTNGLFKYDHNMDVFAPADINENVQSIFEDEDNNIWICSETGVYKMDGNRDHLSFFELDGEPTDRDYFFNVGEAYELNGKLMMGNLLGYYAFDPKKQSKHPDSSKVHITRLWLNKESPGQSTNDPLSSSILGMKEINLDNDQNIFSLSFTETDFQANVNNSIFYKLENYDLDWQETLPEQKVSYFKIPTGRYKLHVKAASSSGIWAEHSITIIIAPPWWNTWWAYIMYVLIISLSVFGVHKFQKTRIIRKEREKAKDKELEQAKEIEKAYTELKNTQSQLIQSEKMASLGELTAGIAHEIQNPLNFVNNFSEVSIDLIEEMNEEIGSGNMDEVKELSEDIKQNLDKINHHGNRASSIVRGMLSHSRTGNKQKELTDINAIADEYLRLAYHGLRAKDKSFNADFKADLDEALPKINVIGQDIGRVLLNLINNAFYAVSAKALSAQKSDSAREEDFKPSVTISTKKIGDRVEIKVRDNGDGIPEGLKDKIFQPFFTTKPTGKGTGLGLSLSYDIIKAHGGELSINTEKGGGAEFIIKIPLAS